MIKLHFNGSVFELKDDYTVADVCNLMDDYTANQNGDTWFHLADGNHVWLNAGENPVYAVESNESRQGLPRGLTTTRKYPGI